jgi:trehalose-phosphatase
MSVRFFDHLPDVEKRLRDSPHWLLGLDFDGTLAPIVSDPADAMLEPRLRPVLSRLAMRPKATIAIMSGRERADLEARVGLAGLIYAGNHGLDISGQYVQFVEPAAVASQPALNAIADAMAEKLRNVAGALVEHKGLTLSVHYRMVAENALDDVRRHVHSVLAGTDHPFVLTTGKCVFEIRPRTYWNKGAAITWIRDQIRPDAQILYLGDDRTDEDAFRVCTDGIAIRVEKSDETAAEFFLDSQTDVFDFLNWLAERV